MQTAELAKQAGVTVHAVRHYADIGLLNPVRNTKNGYFIYGQNDAVTMRFIKKAKSLGYSLKEIALIIGEARKGESPCPLVRRLVDKRIVENRKKIRFLKEAQQKMERARVAWLALKDGIPNGDSVCHLIESISD
ncbi:MAG: MerR family transcriptional regulator [Acidobacteria bacterium]|nr:MerR family transcriptional regulator [Acidobacteriota bacterium]HMQ04362.1 MerR family transcriptional regulator [Pyrinomonadaceae bacterium]